MNPANRQQGLSLIEVVMALFILGVALAGVSNIFAVGFRTMEKNRIKYNCRILAKDLMEEILSKKWEEPGGTDTLGPDTGDENRYSENLDKTFDDVDDYSGLIDRPVKISGVAILMSSYNYNDYRHNVKVEYLTEDADLKHSDTKTNYKKITVRVPYSYSQDFVNPDFSYSISAIVTNHK